MGEKQEGEKQYSLKNIEMRLVETLQQSYFSNLSNVLSFIALERLAYTVTPQTRFRIEDGELYIKEEKPEEEVSTTPEPKAKK